MTRRVAVISGVLLAGVLGWLLSMPSPSGHPFLFFLSIVLVPAGVGIFYLGGVLDDRRASIPLAYRWKWLNTMLPVVQQILAIFGGMVVVGVVAAVLTPPDPFSMVVAFWPLFVIFGIFYFIGLRTGQSEPPTHERISFGRPFQYVLVLLYCVAGVAGVLCGSAEGVFYSPVLIPGIVVLFVFRPRRMTMQEQEA
jgi:preprotein translocase subunit YajC